MEEYFAVLASEYLTKERVILLMLDLFAAAHIKLFVVADGAQPNTKLASITKTQWDEAEETEQKLFRRLEETSQGCFRYFYNKSNASVPKSVLDEIESLRESARQLPYNYNAMRSIVR